MAKKTHKKDTAQTAETYIHRALVHITGVLGCLISISFFTATYDSAQVKLTLLHMGGFLLLALWSALQISRRKNPFSKHIVLTLLPFFAYILWNFICYIFAPLHAEAAEEFIRFLLYGFITFLAATEFTFQDIKCITKWLLVAVVISFAYGAVQVVGLDPMQWRGFFTKRIFSTHANPNFFADFIIFSSCILAGLYWASRQKKYLFLGVIGLVLLFFTESKGAWLAYAVAMATGVLVWVNTATYAKKYRKLINVGVLVALAATSVMVGVYTAKRYQSVSFRTHTWRGTVEMIKDYPVMGVGVGNFKTVYSAYRRPQIFYIENAHNTETQHAENELLEQAAVSGIVGLAVFLWWMGWLFYIAVRTLRRNELPPEKQYYLLGYTTALVGMFVHSWVDISIHFASSGFFFALFTGVLPALCFVKNSDEVVPPDTKPSLLLNGLWLVLSTGVLVLAGWIFVSFYEIMKVLVFKTFGDWLQGVAAWLVAGGVVIGAGVVVLRSAKKLRSAAAFIPLFLLLPTEFMAYCPFQANHFYSLAIALNNLHDLESSAMYFTKAIRLNPLQAEYRQFRANILVGLWNLDKSVLKNRGDKKVASDDFSRALADFQVVVKRSPNHPLLYHNMGQLYYKMALTRSDMSTRARSLSEHQQLRQEALDAMDNAKKSFVRSLKSDPTNPETYVYLANIGLLENNLDDAQRWLDELYKGPDGVTEPDFLQQNRNYPPALRMQALVNARRAQQNSRQ